MLWNLTYAQTVAKRDHLVALGETNVYLDPDSADLPWHLVRHVKEGGGMRLSGPSCARMIAEVDGLTLSWSVNFEGRDANGKGVSLFDRSRLRDVMGKLPPEARRAFAAFLEKEVLPPLEKRAEKVREALNAQLDSVDCVRGLIAYGR